MRIKYSIAIVLLGFLLARCSGFNDVRSKADSSGCLEPPDLVILNKSEFKIAQANIGKFSVSGLDVQSDSEIVEVMSKASKDHKMTEYLLCGAMKEGSIRTGEQADHFRKRMDFMQTDPTPAELSEWQKKNPFPSEGKPTTSYRKISYEVVSISSYNKRELKAVSEIEGTNFSFNLDDPIVTDYYLAKINLKNEGEAIRGSLKFNLSVGTGNAKILDIQHKIITPTHKLIKLAHSLPPLNWELPNHGIPLKISWDYEDDLWRIVGFNVYRSFADGVGYGRLNDQTILETRFYTSVDSIENIYPMYLSVKALGFNGLESVPGRNVKFPDMLAFQPLFRDVYWVDPDKGFQEEADGSNEKPFSSLTEALSNLKKAGSIIINTERDKVRNSQNLSNDPNVFYADDLKFLEGTTEVNLLLGFDEDAHIQLFVLFKLLQPEDIGINFRLEGSPDIKFIKDTSKTLPTLKKKKQNDVLEDSKYFLTPKTVRTYVGEGTIYLLWDKLPGHQYRGVRIFRSLKRDTNDLSNIGDELYDGPGNEEILVCTSSTRRVSIKPSKISDDIIRLDPSTFKPPDRKDRIRPAAPTNLKYDYYFEEHSSYFFADKSVSSEEIYTYTVFAYDDENNYSYPILINASLRDWSPDNNCQLKE